MFYSFEWFIDFNKKIKNKRLNTHLHLGVRLFFKLKDKNITRTERLKTKNIPIIIPTIAAVIMSSSSSSDSKDRKLNILT